MGSTGDSYNNAIAESVIGLYKTELINRRRSWKTSEGVEYATLNWVSWYKIKRLYGKLGYQPPLEIAEEYWDNQKLSGHAARLKLTSRRKTRGDSDGRLHNIASQIALIALCQSNNV